jgi:hypothetical protein
MSNYGKIFYCKTFLFLLLLTLSAATNGQRKTGEWQEFLSYHSAFKVVEGDNQIFCATGGGLFFRDLSDNSLTKLSRRDGLTGQNVQIMDYHPSLEMLMVVYKNSNIDLVFRREIVNMGDIFRKQISGSKTINNIYFHEQDAFLACDFGIVAINLQRREIKGTYIIGEAGSQVAVFDVVVFDQKIYAATASGLFYADRNSTNLLDYRNWNRVSSIPNATSKFSNLQVFNGELLAVFTRGAWDGDEIYALKGSSWERSYREINFVNDIQVKHNYLVITGKVEVHIFDNGRNLIGHIRDYNLPGVSTPLLNTLSATISNDGRLWIADYNYGLIEISGQNFSQNMPSGPLNNEVFNLSFANQSLWIAAGGRTDPWNNQFRRPLFQEFDGNNWTYYSQKEIPEMTGFWDIVQVLSNPSDPGHIFVASWGGGVLEFRNRQLVKRYNNLNSPLETALPGVPDEPYTRIGGMAFDANNTLWITNSQSSKGLHALTPGGDWKSYELSQVAGFQYTIGQVIVTKNNDKWIIVPRGNDVYVVNDDGSRTRHLPVTSYFNNGQIEIINRMNDVYSIAEDLSGDIWIGTSKGVAIFANPARVWQNDTYYAYQPSLDLGDAIYHPLLETETITSIVVDGGNRKWIGTKSSGLYLVSERGDSEIIHFTIENSPLLSNTITSLAMNKATGELFIGTEAGLISYQGDAPAGEDSFAGVYVYPNPVRETYHGPVVIKGLKINTDIRITDIAGNLVHKTKSLGSQAIWDGKNLNGRRVSTGVYLIFAADQTGDDTHVAKLLFIR